MCYKLFLIHRKQPLLMLSESGKCSAAYTPLTQSSIRAPILVRVSPLLVDSHFMISQGQSITLIGRGLRIEGGHQARRSGICSSECLVLRVDISSERNPRLILGVDLAYACAQLPMGWIMQRLPIGRTLGACVTLWGGLMLALGGCNNYASLSVVRVLLGWFEAVITPGFLLIIGSWYLKRESTARQMLYYAM